MEHTSLREEIFGGTLFNIDTGKREYVNESEVVRLLHGIIPPDLKGNFDFSNGFAMVFKSCPATHFSFADTVFMEITRACNLHCTHCLNDSGKAQKDQLSTKEIDSLIDNFSGLGVQEIRFTGGEPLLHPNIYEFIKRARILNIRPSIGTNGTLITPEVAKKLKEAGLCQAVVSLDGTEEAHDKIRGKNNFKRAIDGIKNLQDQGIMVRVNSVLMKNNMFDIIQLAKQLNSQKIPTFIRRFIESGRGTNLKSNMLSATDYEAVKQELVDELNGRYIKGHYLNDKEVTPRIKLPFERTSCSAGRRAFVIVPNGDIHSCGFLAAQGEKPLGNVRQIQDWNKFWSDLNSNKELGCLRVLRDKYNKLFGVQKTNCLAIVKSKEELVR